MDNRFYLQALGITGLFILLMILFWNATEGPPNEAAVQSANGTRTSIALTGVYLLQPRTRTPVVITMTSTSEAQPAVPSQTSTPLPLPSVTSTSLLSQFSTFTPPVAASITPLATMPLPTTPLPTTSVPTTSVPTTSIPTTSVPTMPLSTPTIAATVPVFTTTVSGQLGSRVAPQSPLAATATIAPPPISTVQDPAEFARWYFTRVWNERDYQNLWDNYLTLSYKTNVGSGLFEDYVWWWNSVARVDVNAVEVLQNNGSDAWVRVHLTFHMTDGRVVENQVYEYDFLYDPSRNTWMFDAS